MLDKNADQSLDNNLIKIKNNFLKNNPNIILCKTPFLKSEFLNRFINLVDFHIIFLDIDLLYSGYVKSGFINQNKNVTIVRVNKQNFRMELAEIIENISKKKMMVIIDSLNGLYNMFEESDSARIINASLVLLSCVARYTNSQVLLCGLAIKNEEGKWILSPSGRHILSSKGSCWYDLSLSQNQLKINSLKPVFRSIF